MVLWLIYHDGSASQSSRIAFSNDSVFNVSVGEGFTIIRCHSFMVHGGVLYVAVQFFSWFKLYFP